MADVFISYAREDQPRAEQLASSIVAKGWTVWRDPQIQVGKAFSGVIEAELDAAQCVLVLWSRSSVQSHWVLTEAAEGASRGILVPVLVQDVRIPLEFRRLQTANLMQWQPEVASAEFDACIAAIGALVQPSATVRAQPPKLQSPKPPAANLASTMQSPESEATRPPNSRRKWPAVEWPPVKWPAVLTKSLPTRTIWFVVVIAFLLPLLSFALLDGWLDRGMEHGKAPAPITNTATVNTITSSIPPAMPAPSGADFLTSVGVISFEFTPGEPEQIDRFVELVKKDAYTGAYFQRSPNGVVVLGRLDAYPGAPGVSRLPHERGTLSMPLKEHPGDRLTTLMFVCLNDSPPASLNEKFAVIGRMQDESAIHVAERLRGHSEVAIRAVRLR